MRDEFLLKATKSCQESGDTKMTLFSPTRRATSTLIVLVLASVTALAQTAATPDARLRQLEDAAAAAQSSGDNAWLLTCAALVLMMTGPGLALFYGGLVRRKNVLATMMQSFTMMAVVTVLWALFGYSLAFAKWNFFVGDLHFGLLHNVGSAPNATYAGTIPQQTFMVYQLMFAIITPALITGAFAERMKFSAMLLFMILWSTYIYFPLAHMVWGEGGLLNAAVTRTPREPRSSAKDSSPSVPRLVNSRGS